MRAVTDDYEPRTLRTLAQEALTVLRQHHPEPLRCGYIGSRLFRARKRGSAPYARIAGRAMRLLKETDLAYYDIAVERRSSGWRATSIGLKEDYATGP